MNGNEKLIEEAAKKAAAEHYTHRDVFLEGAAYMSEERSRIPLREAFVEGVKWLAKSTPIAHVKESDTSPGLVKDGADSSHVTPTDDEQEALRRIERDLVEVEHEGGDAWVTTADLRMLLAGFRRSEGAEPSVCTGCHGLKGAHFSTCPEPQGEPSDAQALEDFLGKLAGDGAYTLDFSSAASLHDHIVRLLKRDIAALRAAGGVR